jgi:uncharacterized protein (TIGR02246 family)
MEHVMVPRRLFLALAAVAFTACAPPEQEAAQPAADPAADEAAIAAVRQTYQTAFNAGDAAGVAALLTADMYDMQPGMPTVVGASAVQEGLAGMFQQNNAQIEITGQKTEVSGDMGYDRGTYRTTITPKAGGAAMTEEGRYLVVLKRQADGSWKLVELMGNAPTAPAAAPAP